MRTLARLRHLTAAEVPFRIGEQWVLWTDRSWRPPATPDGPCPGWDQPPPAVGPWVEPPPPSDDPRDAWEITRLYHLAAQARDPRARAEALRWLDEHPPGQGLGWEAAIEVAIRLVSLVRVATHLPHPAFRAAIHAHAAWIARHPSRGTSANNHRVAELGALALASVVLADLPDASRFRREAAELADVLDDQVHPDGVGVEQSPSYLAFDLEWALIARRCGVAGLNPPLRRAARFLWTLHDAGGHAPAIGDDDGGRVVALNVGPEPGYVRSVTGAARAAFGDPVPAGWTPDLRSQASAVVGSAGSTCFPVGGLTVLVRGRLQAVFDHGPLGGCTLAAHGHADALSVWVSVDGQPVVVGRGTGRYHGDPVGRRFHRGTSAHPTAQLDGVDPSQAHDDPFLWRTRASCVLEEADLAAGTVTARCGRHRRTVTVHDDRLVIVDQWLGDGRHHVAIRFPLAPGHAVGPDLAIRGVGRFVGDPALRATVVTGGPRPGLGWHSPSYGVWVEATTVTFEGHVRLPITLRTTLVLG